MVGILPGDEDWFKRRHTGTGPTRIAAKYAAVVAALGLEPGE